MKLERRITHRRSYALASGVGGLVFLLRRLIDVILKQFKPAD